MKNLCLILVASLFLASCGSISDHTIDIDNPTEYNLVVMVGDQKYEVSAYETVSVEIADGEHKITSTLDGETIVDETVTINDDGILNATAENYLTWTDLYLIDQDEYEDLAEKHLNETTIYIDGYEYYGDFQLFEGDVFIAEDWDYGLTETWPDEIDIHGDYLKKSKVYHEYDLDADY